MAIRGVIFDLGGTLLQLPAGDHAEVALECDAHLARFLRAAGVAGAQVDAVVAEARTALQRWRQGGTVRQLTRERNLAAALRRCGVRLAPRLVGSAALVWCQPEFGLWRPAAGAAGVLARLRAAGLRVGLCSNTAWHSYVLHLLALHRLERDLDPVVTSAAVGWRKPDRRAFLPLLRAWGLPAAEVVVVGDDLRCAVAGAAALGMATVCIPPAGGDGQGGPRPWRVAADLRQVPEFLLGS